MKQKLLALACMMMVLFCACRAGVTSNGNNQKGTFAMATTSQVENEPIFRNIKWGMSISEVKTAEDKVPDDEYSNAVFYDYDTVWGQFCDIGYVFSESGKLNLISVKFLEIGDPYDPFSIMEPKEVSAQNIKLYQTVKKDLIRRYGEPDQDTENWNSDLHKNDPASALLVGDVAYMSHWDLDDTDIGCVLSCKDDKPSLFVLIQSKKYQDKVPIKKQVEKFITWSF